MKKHLPAIGEMADAKTEFFMAASHQLKSPVAVIQWCMNVLLETPNMSAEQVKLVRKTLDQANSMSQLLAELLHVFRLQSGREGMEKVQVRMAEVIDEVLARLEDKAKSRNIKVRKGPFESTVTILANRQLIEQVVVNLVDNAIKYSRTGGHVEVSLTRKKNDAVLSVKDAGIGIADSELHSLFTEFFRGVEAREVADGTGLGLVLVKQIVEKHSGSVFVESKVGKGTEFTVSLPLLPKH